MMTVGGLVRVQFLLGLMCGCLLFASLATWGVDDPLWLRIAFPLASLAAAIAGMWTCLRPPPLVRAEGVHDTGGKQHQQAHRSHPTLLVFKPLRNAFVSNIWNKADDESNETHDSDNQDSEPDGLYTHTRSLPRAHTPMQTKPGPRTGCQALRGFRPSFKLAIKFSSLFKGKKLCILPFAS